MPIVKVGPGYRVVAGRAMYVCRWCRVLSSWPAGDSRQGASSYMQGVRKQ